MHELGLATNIARIVRDKAEGKPVVRVRLAIGPLACVEICAIKFCWDIVTQGGPLEGAKLEIVEAEADMFVIKEFELGEAA